MDKSVGVRRVSPSKQLLNAIRLAGSEEEGVLMRRASSRDSGGEQKGGSKKKSLPYNFDSHITLLLHKFVFSAKYTAKAAVRFLSELYLV